jgi:enoyl-CoA hydratase/carnithine racemase
MSRLPVPARVKELILVGEWKVSKAVNNESRGDLLGFETLTVRREGAVLFAEIVAPPMNLLGPELVRDLVSIIQSAEADDAVQVLVFKSADPDYFISHVDLTRIPEYRAEAAKLTGEASIALLFRHLSASRLVTIAQIEGRVRAAGNEFVLGCDMRFAARESAVFGQFEPAFGLLPGGGGAQHLTRLMGRARALEVMLSAEDYDAELAERYGWINRALPAAELGDFVSSLAHRIARFPAAGHAVVKDRVNAIALAPVDDFRRDSDLFGADR